MTGLTWPDVAMGAALLGFFAFVIWLAVRD